MALRIAVNNGAVQFYEDSTFLYAEDIRDILLFGPNAIHPNSVLFERKQDLQDDDERIHRWQFYVDYSNIFSINGIAKSYADVNAALADLKDTFWGPPPTPIVPAPGSVFDVNVVSPLGQAAMAASIPVVVASNQSTLNTNVTNGGGASAVNIQDGGNSITVDAASLPLPTGAATETTLAGVLTTTAFQARINTLGQKTMANSTPIVIASDQSTYPVTINTTTIAPQATSIGAYTSANKVFSLSVAVNMSTAGTNNPVILFKNPGGSGKTVYIYRIRANTNVANVLTAFKVFGSPTITANGTAQTPRNNNIGNGTASSMTLFTLPTISLSGNEIASATSGQNSNSEILVDGCHVAVPAGADLLITGDPSSNNRIGQFTVVYIEI